MLLSDASTPEWLFCLHCRARTRCVQGTCQKCSTEGAIVAWQCRKCNRVVRGTAPNGPAVCGECPEPVATLSERMEFLDDNGNPRIEGDTTLDECCDCYQTIRRTSGNTLPRGKARCLECAVGKVVKCCYPLHKGDRNTPRHQAQLGVYAFKTKSNQTQRRHDVLCGPCYDRAGAVYQAEVASHPLLSLLPATPYVLEVSPRDSYPKDVVIFDQSGAKALDEKRVIRLDRLSIKRREYKLKDITYIDCEELRLVNGTIERRESVTFNRRVARAINHHISVKREAQNLFLREHQKLANKAGTIDAASLGWFMIECHALDNDKRAMFHITYPSLTIVETTAQWAHKVLR